jgi:glycosyltransferase involved in cell wall biosynthesis
MSRRIYFDGLNLSLERGTGIATYTRLLAGIARDLGHEIGVVYSSRNRPSKNPLLREIAFFDYRDDNRRPGARDVWDAVVDQCHYPFGIKPGALNLSGLVVTDQFKGRMPTAENLFVARNLFANARRYFSWSGRFTDLEFDTPPDILHCTYQLPVRAKSACNVYTIHDLVPLRLPFTTLDNKRQTYRLLRKIGAQADHIVTVSEHSKRDIIELLGVDEKRVTNTYEALECPRACVERPDDVVAEQLQGSFADTQHHRCSTALSNPRRTSSACSTPTCCRPSTSRWW